MKNILKKSLCLCVALLMFIAAMSGCGTSTKELKKDTTPAVTEPLRQLRENMQTILVMVTDAYDLSDTSGSYRNGNKADFLLLLVVDGTAGSVKTLQLNSDAIIPFSLPGQAETVEIPLGLVYSYGSGGSDSHLNICKAVSNVIDGIPVNHYLSFSIDAIGIVSDLLGGVSPTDFSETGMLQGADAISFFHTREEGDVANEAHMERQRQFMMGMYRPFMVSAQDDDFLTTLTMQLGERMATDLTLSQLLPLFETLAAYEMEENVLTVSGEATLEEGEYRFHMDQGSLDQALDALICQ